MPRRLAGEVILTRDQTTAFWEKHRAAMAALKRSGDCAGSIPLFEAALAIDPTHQDARYYLANCLATEGDPTRALAELGQLRRQNPESQRAHRQWALLKAIHATSRSDLEAAEAAALRALEVNQEETGSLLLLGEIALLRGDNTLADERLELATRTNHRAIGGFYLRGYIAWREGRTDEGVALLEAAHGARGDEWKPEGTVAEGDVGRQMHRETSPLSRYWATWDGTPNPDAAYRDLAAHVDSVLALPGVDT